MMFQLSYFYYPWVIMSFDYVFHTILGYTEAAIDTYSDETNKLINIRDIYHIEEHRSMNIIQGLNI